MVLLNIEAIETENKEFTPLPDGWYATAITESAIKTGKDSGFDYLNLEFTVTSGDYTSRKVWMRYSLWHERDDVVRWAREKLGKLAAALRLPSIDDHEELQGKQVEIQVGPDKKGDTEVKYYRASGNTPPTPESSNGKMESWAA